MKTYAGMSMEQVHALNVRRVCALTNQKPPKWAVRLTSDAQKGQN